MKNEKSVFGYKVFNSDFTCHGFQYAENKEYVFEGKIKICSSGFHFCEKASDCFSYYSFDPQNIVCEVEGRGKIESEEDGSKKCTDKIFIGRKLTWDEVLKVANEGLNNTGHSNSGNSNSGNCNSGNSNSGYRNSGNWNSGYRNSGNSNSGNCNSGNSNSGNCNSGNSNSGNCNSGNCNSGNRNSGNWNSGYRNSGYSNSGYRNSGAFCIDNNPKLFLFDKLTDINVRDWENSEPIRIMNSLLLTAEWIYENSMTDIEKEKYPTYKTTGGYLKTKTMYEAWADVWNNLDDTEKQVFLDLPNFDADKFKIITGIEVKK